MLPRIPERLSGHVPCQAGIALLTLLTAVVTTAWSPAANTGPGAPAPIRLAGIGSQVVALNNWSGSAVLQIDSPANSDLRVDARQAGHWLPTVPEAGSSRPTYVLLGIPPGQQIDALRVTSASSWRIRIFPLTEAYFPAVRPPSVFEACGDAMVLIVGENGIATFSFEQEQTPAVWALNPEGRVTPVHINGANSDSVYRGRSVLPEHTQAILVRAKGRWQVRVSEPCCRRQYTD